MEKTKKPSLDKDGLNLREKLFAFAYISNRGNGVEAAREAGYNGDLPHRATDLLAKPQVKAVIDRERARLMRKAEITAERVLCELARVAFFRVSRLFRPDNTPIPLSQLDDDASAVISSVDFRKGTVKLRFANKLQALDLLGRWLKLWEGEGAQSNDKLAEVIAALRAGPVKPTLQLVRRNDEQA